MCVERPQCFAWIRLILYVLNSIWAQDHDIWYVQFPIHLNNQTPHSLSQLFSVSRMIVVSTVPRIHCWGYLILLLYVTQYGILAFYEMTQVMISSTVLNTSQYSTELSTLCDIPQCLCNIRHPGWYSTSVPQSPIVSPLCSSTRNAIAVLFTARWSQTNEATTNDALTKLFCPQWQDIFSKRDVYLMMLIGIFWFNGCDLSVLYPRSWSACVVFLVCFV